MREKRRSFEDRKHPGLKRTICGRDHGNDGDGDGNEPGRGRNNGVSHGREGLWPRLNNDQYQSEERPDQPCHLSVVISARIVYTLPRVFI
jgi:hypothetical protein